MIKKWLIIFAITEFLILLLLAQVALENQVFFSGDGGLKYLWAKHFADTGLLTLPKPSQGWARALWEQGYAPLRPPFAYLRSGEYWISFPLLFPVIVSWLIPSFGTLSQFIVPLASWLIIVVSFYTLLFKSPLISSSKNLAFLFLLLSPLCWYGAIFWEHSAACACLTIALWFRIIDEYSSRNMVVAGLLCGAASLFRPEAIVISLFWGFGMLVTLEQRRSQKLWFLSVLGAVLVGLVLFNIHLYGTPFGLHGQQMTKSLTLFSRIRIVILMLVLLAAYLPWVIVAVLRGGYEEFSTTIIGSLLAIPLILPNEGVLQIGPRYYLVLVPFAVAAWGLTRLEISRIGGALLLTATIFMWGYSGLKVYRNYAGRIAPAIAQIKAAQGDAILSNSVYPFQELQGAEVEAPFFLVTSASDMETVLASCREQQLHSVLWISRTDRLPPDLEVALSLHGCRMIGRSEEYRLSSCSAL